MNEDDKDRFKRRKDPFNFFGLDDRFFNDMFDDRIFDDFKRMAEELFRMMENAKPGKSYVHGYSIRVGPDGKPHLEEFGNHHLRSNKGETSISEDREPLTDVIESSEDVSVTIELPGVDKEDIDLRVVEEELEIRVNTPQRKYHKIVHLPVDVKPKTTKATYKNGILDVSIQRKRKKMKEENGFKVNIN
jgi:HSP20 family protein